MGGLPGSTGTGLTIVAEVEKQEEIVVELRAQKGFGVSPSVSSLYMVSVTGEVHVYLTLLPSKHSTSWSYCGDRGR